MYEMIWIPSVVFSRLQGYCFGQFAGLLFVGSMLWTVMYLACLANVLNWIVLRN